MYKFLWSAHRGIYLHVFILTAYCVSMKKLLRSKPIDLAISK